MGTILNSLYIKGEEGVFSNSIFQDHINFWCYPGKFLKYVNQIIYQGSLAPSLFVLLIKIIAWIWKCKKKKSLVGMSRARITHIRAQQRCYNMLLIYFQYKSGGSCLPLYTHFGSESVLDYILTNYTSLLAEI